MRAEQAATLVETTGKDLRKQMDWIDDSGSRKADAMRRAAALRRAAGLAGVAAPADAAFLLPTGRLLAGPSLAGGDGVVYAEVAGVRGMRRTDRVLPATRRRSHAAHRLIHELDAATRPVARR